MTVEFYGESFSVVQEDGQTWVTHAQWSLNGHGDTLDAALCDLKINAKDLAPYMRTEESNVSLEWKRLRKFVLLVEDDDLEINDCDLMPLAGHSQKHATTCRSYRADALCKCGQPLYDGHEKPPVTRES